MHEPSIAHETRDVIGRARQELLEVVEHEQHPALGEGLAERRGDRSLGRRRDPDRGRDRGVDELRIANRGELHEGHAIGEAVAGSRRDRHPEPGLARTARTGQGHDLRRVEQPAHDFELVVPSHERGQALWQVGSAQRPQWPLVVGRAGHDEAMHRPWLVEVLEPARTGGQDRRTLRQGMGETTNRVVAEHDLAAVPRGSEACRIVHVHTDVVRAVGGQRPVARVDADSDAHSSAGRERRAGEGATHGNGRGDRIRGGSEGRERTVALVFDHGPVVLTDGRLDEHVVHPEQSRPLGGDE